MSPVATDSKRLVVKQYIRTQLEGMRRVDGYFNDVGYVTTPHPTLEQFSGDAEAPTFSYQDEDCTTDPMARSYDTDMVTMRLSVRGAKKIAVFNSPFEVEEHAERMLRDIWAAIMRQPGMGCGALTVAIVSPTRVVQMEGVEGWATCVLNVEVQFQHPHGEP